MRYNINSCCNSCCGWSQTQLNFWVLYELSKSLGP